jgi:hypothetical protein
MIILMGSSGDFSIQFRNYNNNIIMKVLFFIFYFTHYTLPRSSIVIKDGGAVIVLS